VRAENAVESVLAGGEGGINMGMRENRRDVVLHGFPLRGERGSPFAWRG